MKTEALTTTRRMVTLIAMGWAASGCGAPAGAAPGAAHPASAGSCPSDTHWDGSSCVAEPAPASQPEPGVATAPAAPAPELGSTGPASGPPPTDRPAGVAPAPSDPSPATPPPGATPTAPADSGPLATLNQDRIELREPIRFKAASSTVLPESEPALNAVVAILVTFPDIRLEIGAHTDSQGSSAMNTAISQGRADAIRTFLVGQGIAQSRLTAKGYGESAPIASNRTAEGRAQNRRIELRVR